MMEFKMVVFMSTLLGSGLIFCTSANANDALYSRLNGQAVYDATTNLTWIANGNLLASNTFGLSYNTSYGSDAYGYPTEIYTNGTATLSGAQKWVNAMNSANYLGFNDWRLPTSLQPDTSCQYMGAQGSWGYGCGGSEMGNLFIKVLGGVPGQSLGLSLGLNNGSFSNLQASNYWTSTETLNAAYAVFNYYIDVGFQDMSNKGDNEFVLVVRTGDVAAVPEAQTYALMLAGLGLVGWRARRRG